MIFEPKTIGEHIECLARMTGAPESFVGQVRGLFSTKGISLDEDAAPYLNALEEAFRREESIRTSSQRARQNIARLQDNFSRIGKAYVQQLEQLRKGRKDLAAPGRGDAPSATAKRKAGTELAIPGDHRTYVTRQQTEQMPMVPGPKDEQ